MNNRRNFNCFILISAAILMLSACSAKGGSSAKVNEADKLNTVTDMEGTIVEIPSDIKRVACISPSATDLMIAFGLGDKIAGTYRSFTYNTWAEKLYPGAGDYKPYSYSVTAEELIADKIDLVIIQDTENAEQFRNAGIPVVAVHQYSPDGPFDDEIYETARLIGDIFGGDAKNRADEWCQDVKSTIDGIRSKVPESQEKAVYYVNGEKEKGLFYSDGGNSMISTVLSTSGVVLATEKYDVLNVHEVSDEEMVKLNPYAIMIGGAYQNNLIDELNESSLWSNLECSVENRVYRIPVAMVGIENVSAETPVMLEYTASLFNEDYDYDLHNGLKENIRKYFGYELSDEDVENMCMGLSETGERMVDTE